MVERSLVNKTGRVHSKAVERVDVKTLKPILKECIAEGATVNTDEATVYYYCNDDFKHDVIRHKAKEYSFKEGGRRISTNTVEGYFATLKRGITASIIMSDASTFTAT